MDGVPSAGSMTINGTKETDYKPYTFLSHDGWRKRSHCGKKNGYADSLTL